MYVFDTALEPKTSLLGDARLQRLIFRLPDEVMATAKRDRRRLLNNPRSAEVSPPPWDAQGRVCFSYSGKTGNNVFKDVSGDGSKLVSNNIICTLTTNLAAIT